MITRLVKLTLLPERTLEFEQFFAREAADIGTWPGCQGVKAFRDSEDSGIYFTQSLWESAQALEAYRQSDFFRSNWQVVKAWFAAPAQAWSTYALPLEPFDPRQSSSPAGTQS